MYAPCFEIGAEVLQVANLCLQVHNILPLLKAAMMRACPVLATRNPLIQAFLKEAQHTTSQPRPAVPSNGDAPAGPSHAARVPRSTSVTAPAVTTPPRRAPAAATDEKKNKQRPPRDSDRGASSGEEEAGGDALAGRKGYDPTFLGVRVMLPSLSSWATERFGQPFVLPTTGGEERVLGCH